jgi:hypothetical protein
LKEAEARLPAALTTAYRHILVPDKSKTIRSIDPLAKEGADIQCQVIIIGQGDGAIRENTVELGIKESLSQRGIKADIQVG